MRIDWKKVDWEKSDAEISDEMGVSKGSAWIQRKKAGQPRPPIVRRTKEYKFFKIRVRIEDKDAEIRVARFCENNGFDVVGPY